MKKHFSTEEKRHHAFLNQILKNTIYGAEGVGSLTIGCVLASTQVYGTKEYKLLLEVRSKEAKTVGKAKKLSSFFKKLLKNVVLGNAKQGYINFNRLTRAFYSKNAGWYCLEMVASVTQLYEFHGKKTKRHPSSKLRKVA